MRKIEIRQLTPISFVIAALLAILAILGQSLQRPAAAVAAWPTMDLGEFVAPAGTPQAVPPAFSLPLLAWPVVLALRARLPYS